MTYVFIFYNFQDNHQCYAIKYVCVSGLRIEYYCVVCQKSVIKHFLAVEEAACNLINCLQ